MNQNRKLLKLSEREEDVMAVFWKTDKAMTAVQVAEESEHLKLNTVKPVVQKLLQKNFIEVAGIVHSGPSIARTYNYVVSAEEYAADQLQAMRSNSFSFSALNFVNHLIEQEECDDILRELEEILKHKKGEQ